MTDRTPPVGRENHDAASGHRFTERGGECRRAHVEGYTGPICSCGPMECKATRNHSENEKFDPAPVRLDSLRAEAERSNRPNPAMFTIPTETALALIVVAERAIVCVEQRDVLATYQGDRLREALEAI